MELLDLAGISNTARTHAKKFQISVDFFTTWCLIDNLDSLEVVQQPMLPLRWWDINLVHGKTQMIIGVFYCHSIEFDDILDRKYRPFFSG